MRSRFLASVALLGLLSFSGAAFAGKSGDEGGSTELVILDTKVPEVDSFYDKVEALIGQLQAARTDIDQANGKLNEALGIATDAPIATALLAAGKPFLAQPVSPAEALFRLMRRLINADNLPGKGFDAAAHLARKTIAYHLIYSDIVQVAAWVEKLANHSPADREGGLMRM